MAEPTLSAGDTPCQCTRPELSEFSRFLKDSGYPNASKGEIIRSWLAVRKVNRPNLGHVLIWVISNKTVNCGATKVCTASLRWSIIL